MYKTTVTVNIGQDAEKHTAKTSGKEFITFSACNTEGDNSKWFKCYIQNDRMVQGKIVDYLKKGTKLLVEGRQSAKVYTKNDGTTGLENILNVFQLELLGSSTANPNESAPAVPVAPIVIPNEAKKDLTGKAPEDDDLPF
jgi:single-stranded DNA-binding protein